MLLIIEAIFVVLGGCILYALQKYKRILFMLHFQDAGCLFLLWCNRFKVTGDQPLFYLNLYYVSLNFKAFMFQLS